MTTSSAANKGSARAWQARGAAGWLGLAASPTFALMAWIAANDAPPIALCSSGSGILPIDGMTCDVPADEPLPPVALAEARFRPPAGSAPNRQPKETDHEPCDRFARRVA